MSDLTAISFGEQVINVIQSDPHGWYNCSLRKAKPADRGYVRREFFCHQRLGRFRVRGWPWCTLEHLGVSHPRGLEDQLEGSRWHVRIMTWRERREAYRQFIAWKQRALNLNALPLADGSLAFGP